MAKNKSMLHTGASGRDVKTHGIAPVACVNAPVCDVEVSERAWCIARDRLTDLLCVVQKRVFPQYASQVGRALMRVLRNWPDELGVHWFAALKNWAVVASWAPELLSSLQDQLGAARAELVSTTHALSLKAASSSSVLEEVGSVCCVGSEEACFSVGQGQRSHSTPCASDDQRGNEGGHASARR